MSHTPKTPTPSYTTANLPSDLSEGSVVFDSTKQKSVIFKSGSWVDFGTENIGTPSYVRDIFGGIDQIQGNIPQIWKNSDTSLRGLVIGTSCKTIGIQAFYFSSIVGSLVIPESVTTIANSCFLNAKLDGSLYIPSSLTSLGIFAFANTLIDEVFCRTTRNVMNASNCLQSTNVSILHARASDTTWTAGTDTIGGKTLTVVKDL